MNLKKQIIEDIVADLRDRRGLKHEWDQIEPEIQKKIIKKWESLIQKRFDEAVKIYKNVLGYNI